MANPQPKPDGLVLLDKPPGITSHDCVASVRKLCAKKFKVGHGGTLDPFCTGLLILLLGKGTRLASLFQGMDKAYEGVIRFGEGTDTFDRDGHVVETGKPPRLGPEEWQAAANQFVRPALMQVPPAFSAKRIGRVRSYKLARQGMSVPLDPVKVSIYQFQVMPVGERDLHFRLRCSSGTYVRAVARDLGELLGSPAHCFQLCRTEVGPFTVHQTNALDNALEGPGFLPFDSLDLGLPVHRVTHREERLILFGQKIPAPAPLYGLEGPIRILGPSERFLALAKVEGVQIQPTVVFGEG
jgi:tRNA pseudouridine55 synthase